MLTTGKIKSTRKVKIKSTSKKVAITSRKKSIAELFGINKKEVDGLQFQKKVRNEWQ